MLRKVLTFLIISFFVLGSAYLVLHYEYQEGRFSHYFFKTNLYYSRFNKIIFPVYFWGCFTLALIVLNFFQIIRVDRHQILNFFRYGILFHLYLLLLSHSQGSTPGFTITPTKFSPASNFIQYENFFMTAYFMAYYFFAVHTFHARFKTEYKLGEEVLPISMIVPYGFLASPEIHAVYLGVALLLFLVIQNFPQFWEAVKDANIFRGEWRPVFLIFALGLFFRLWYAHYFTSIEFDTIGFSADGPAYYKSAVAFSEGNFENVNFWYAPLYSFYLAGFMMIFGRSPDAVFYGQALAGSLMPVLIYLIARLLANKKTAVIAAVLAATSHLCIHYSVVVNRACPLVITIPAMVYLCLKIKKESPPWKFIAFGMLAGATFYFGQETLLVLAVFFAYFAAKFFKQAVSTNWILRNSAWIAVGIIIITFPLNWIWHQRSDGWIPLGRDTLELNRGDSTFAYSGNPYAKKMMESGFSPIKNPKESLKVFFREPGTITALLLGKTITEIPGFLLDPGGLFFMPLHFSPETFYGAHIQFYIYLFVSAGLVIFIRRNEMGAFNKMLILVPIISQLLLASLIIMGTFRFRVPITPLNMLLAAYAVNALFFGSPRKYGALEKPLNFPSIEKQENSQPKDEQWKKALLAGGAVAMIIFGIGATVSNVPSLQKLESQPTPWLSFDNTLKKIFPTHEMRLNGTIFAFYKIKENELLHDSIISFKICRFLMSGMKPYYRVAIDGRFSGSPKQVPLGCSEIQGKFPDDYLQGTISLFVYASYDGKTSELKPGYLTLDDGSQIKVPIFSPPLSMEGLEEYVARFKKYSYEYVKVSPPEILARL